MHTLSIQYDTRYRAEELGIVMVSSSSPCYSRNDRRDGYGLTSVHGHVRVRWRAVNITIDVAVSSIRRCQPVLYSCRIWSGSEIVLADPVGIL